MIPKIIHCFWIGNKPLSKLAKKCIASWKKVMPDYDIKLWNEKNYDFSKNEFMKSAYEQKKWAFVSDYARLDIIYNYGGIYLDTDVEVLKPFDELLNYPAFCGFQYDLFVNFGLGFGAEKGNVIIKKIIEAYDNCSLDIDLETKQYIQQKYVEEYSKNKPFMPSPIIQTQILRANYNLKQNNKRQSLQNMEVFPNSFFCPTNKVFLPIKTKTAYSVHWFASSWCSNKKEITIKNFIKRILGEKLVVFFMRRYRK